ncbi:MAG: hypothetical protein HKN91_06950 [Acidimicrobiia bacterium]|nr:hypothetical protein [Acidimicrobiia bacterium]
MGRTRRSQLDDARLGLLAADRAAWLDALMAYLESNLGFIADFIAHRLAELRLERPDALYLA